MFDIRPYLEKLDATIDPAHAVRTHDRQMRACRFQPVDRAPVVIGVADVPDWPRHPLDVAFDDRDRMLMNELRPIYASALIGDDRAGSIRANFGIVIIGSLFGCRVKLTGDAMPWLEPLDDVEKIHRIVRTGLPDTRGGVWPRIAEFQEYARETLARYPRIREHVRLSCCDMQGPFSIAHEVWGNDIYIAVVDDPDLVIAFVEVVTETYLRFIAQERAAVAAAPDFTEFISVLVPGTVMVREDSATNLSPRMYERFCAPYIQRTLDAFPGGVHYCGAGYQIFPQACGYRNLTSMNFGNAAMQRPETIREKLIDRGIAVVGWNDWPIAPALASAPTGLTIETSVATLEEAKRLMDRVRAGNLTSA